MTEKLFVTGATGVLGRPAVRRLVAAGYDVRAVARDATKAAELRDAGAEPTAVDLFDADAVKVATEGVDAILHLATHIPALRDMSRPGAWNENNRLRTEGTRNLLDAATTHAVGTFVKESITLVYPDRGDQWIDETVPPDGSNLALRPTLEGERLLDGFVAGGGRGVVLRFGSFYGSATRAVDDYLELARWRVAPIAGRPGAYHSSIHTDDAATAVVAALDLPSGIYNVVDDEPLTGRAITEAFATAFGTKRLHPMPSWVLRLTPRSPVRSTLASQRVSNARFREETGWSPTYPSVREGWARVAAARAGATDEESFDA